MKVLIIKVVLSFTFAFSFLTLAACSGNNVFRDRGNDYKMMAESQSLVIPKGVSVEARSDEYEIPEKDEQTLRLTTIKMEKNKQRLAAESLAKVNEKKMAAGTLLYSSKADPKYAEEFGRIEAQRKATVPDFHEKMRQAEVQTHLMEKYGKQ